MTMQYMKKCPGRYCGLLAPGLNNTLDSNFVFDISSCTGCAKGFHVDPASGFCVECTTLPALYDFLYLGFMAMLPLLLNSFFIEYYRHHKPTPHRSPLKDHLLALAECLLSAATSFLLVFKIGPPKACRVRQLSDWYTIFYNPVVNFKSRLHCTHEAVYPLYSLPFLYYFVCILTLFVLRILLVRKKKNETDSSKNKEKEDYSPVYAALYFYPFLILAHAVFAGLIYYYFPYILLTVCLIANALHLGAFEDQTFKGILRTVVTNRRSTVSIFVLSLAYVYAIIALTNLQNLVLPACLTLFVPVPTLFYAASAPFSAPNNLNFVGSSRTVAINR